MKKTAFILLAMIATASVSAQENKTVIEISDDNIFSRCFENCDADGNNIVTLKEARQATLLALDKGGRSNIIENYDFLKYFPNLTHFSVGNTTVETLDLSQLGKLQQLNLANALFVKKLILAEGCNPEINYPADAQVEIVHATKPSVIAFKDQAIKDFCLRNEVDADNDGEISVAEAAQQTSLCLMNFKSFMRQIKDYTDLQYFPNIEILHAGMSYAETIDLSCCTKLKTVDLSDCRMLKTVILARGCKPEIVYPVAYKGAKAKVVYQ